MNNAARGVLAKDQFRVQLSERGITLIGEYVNSKTKVLVRCSAGHERNALPSNIRRFGCGVCKGNDSSAAQARFLARLEELGAASLARVWNGVNAPHEVRCAAGHTSAPHPGSVLNGQGVCSTCARNNTNAAEALFRTRVLSSGATLLESAWLGTKKKHQVRCAEGHVVDTYPTNVLRGRGICHVCAGKVWDAFYVVFNPVSGVLKFGITSGDPKPRLADHCSDGFTEVVRVFTDLPGGEARGLERELMTLLRCAGVEPVRGREYFPSAARNVVLGTVDAWFDS